jgi:hypothetical protein
MLSSLFNSKLSFNYEITDLLQKKIGAIFSYLEVSKKRLKIRTSEFINLAILNSFESESSGTKLNSSYFRVKAFDRINENFKNLLIKIKSNDLNTLFQQAISKIVFPHTFNSYFYFRNLSSILSHIRALKARKEIRESFVEIASRKKIPFPIIAKRFD